MNKTEGLFTVLWSDIVLDISLRCWLIVLKVNEWRTSQLEHRWSTSNEHNVRISPCQTFRKQRKQKSCQVFSRTLEFLWSPFNYSDRTCGILNIKKWIATVLKYFIYMTIGNLVLYYISYVSCQSLNTVFAGEDPSQWEFFSSR